MFTACVSFVLYFVSCLSILQHDGVVCAEVLYGDVDMAPVHVALYGRASDLEVLCVPTPMPQIQQGIDRVLFA